MEELVCQGAEDMDSAEKEKAFTLDDSSNRRQQMVIIRTIVQTTCNSELDDKREEIMTINRYLCYLKQLGRIIMKNVCTVW